MKNWKLKTSEIVSQRNMGHKIGILVGKLYFCRKIAPFVGKIDKKIIFWWYLIDPEFYIFKITQFYRL